MDRFSSFQNGLFSNKSIRPSAMFGLIGIISYLFIQAAFAATKTPSPSNQGISLLYQNNLNFTDDINHSSFLFLDGENTYEGASAACSSLSEQLLPLSSLRSSLSDISQLVQYLQYEGKITGSTNIWVQGGYITPDRGLVFQPVARNSNQRFAALCTQTANGTTDTTSIANNQNQISVTSGGNTFIGYRNKKSFRFLGVPFADNTARWTYSKPYSQRGKTIQATTFGDSCYISPSASNAGYSENCLFLNVFTPYLPNSSGSSKNSGLKPVALWVTGGGYTSGTGSDPTFDGGNIASRGDVVVVTVNYRLSTLGFLSIPGTNIKGNYGFADVITALEWVKQNIESFGGDPNRVTVFGQSAGAGTTRALLGSVPAQGLFHAAIPESNLGGYDYGTTYSEYYTPEQEYQVAGEAIVEALGCANSHNVESCLGAVDAETIVNLPTVARYLTVDGYYIRQSHIDVTGRSYLADVPVILGTARDDGSPFIGYPTSTDYETSIESLLSFNSSFTESILNSGLFPLPGDSIADVYNVSSRLATDVIFRCIDQATVYSAVKHRKLPAVYYYQFDRTYDGYDPNNVCSAPVTDTHPFGDPSLPYYRCHSGELYYVFGTLNQFGLHFRDQYDLPFNQLIMDYWTSFFRTYDPNPSLGYLNARGYSGTKQAISVNGNWPRYDASNPGIFILDEPKSALSPLVDFDQCKFLGLPIDFYE